MNQLFSRPALGQQVPLGTLYDARTDSFLTQTLSNGEIPREAIKSQQLQDTSIQTCPDGSYAKKVEAINIGPDLAASLLSGLLPPQGYAHYLLDHRTDSQGHNALICHTLAVVQEKLDLTSQVLKSCVAPAPIRSSAATHVVVEIDYGAQSIITVNQWLRFDQLEEKQDGHRFTQKVEDFVHSIKDTQHGQYSSSSDEFDQITVYSTVLGPNDIVLNDSQEARKFLDLVSLQIKAYQGGKGKPILYRILPIQMLAYFNLATILEDAPFVGAGPDSTKKFIQLCDEFRKCQQSLRNYEYFATRNKFCLPPMHLQDIAQRIQQLQRAEQDLQRAFGQALHNVRTSTADSNQLWQILNDFDTGSRSSRALSTFTEDYRGKVEFVDLMTTLGATYIGFNGIDLQSQLKKRGTIDTYCFFFDDSARKNQESWDANVAMMLSLLDAFNGQAFFAIVDCNAGGISLEKATITQYHNGAEVVHDLQEEQQYLAVHCLARRHPNTLETEDVQKPTKRRFVKIPCPGRNCGAGGDRDWQCWECRSPLEFGFTDQYIYCDCGRSLYTSFDFKCNGSDHGQNFDSYDDARLLAFLNSLTASNYLNLLILGETGVGKSTFINAFVNYLYFSTLDEALKHEELHWVIPCSFAIQTMDRSNSSNEIAEVKIEVGSRDDEHDGSTGKSATQTTQVYPITVEDTTYRLIDTPGIGDTRGLEFDKKNMEDILKTVSGYDDLHGILILLKPNNARLTAQFSFCVKELLTHLHRDAANNVVFGFTNTRVSNYTPGDTLGPLKTLLAERKDIGLSLTKQTTYCFDSESFRYLAAAKQKGVFLENKSNFDSSWATSRSEAELMLNYFKVKKPHPIKDTISLNATRNLILELVKPMTEITQVIRNNIALQEDDVRLLQDHRLTGDKLRAKLHPEKELLKKKDTTKPRTVCTDKSCMEFKDDGTGNQTVLIDYPSPCHAVCYLQDVDADVRAHPNLFRCSAFLGAQDCQQCGHHWTLHMHILYELEAYREKVLDHTIQKLIKEHASDLTKKQAAIAHRKQLVAEYQNEHDQVQEAAAKFGVWMKANSILPYNDATVSYLEMLIKNEQAKVDAGGINNKKVLADLEQDLAKHQELVRVLDDSMKGQGKSASLSEVDIQHMVKHLYDLKHFGTLLEDLKMLNTQEHEKTNREKPHRIKAKYVSKHTTYQYQVPIASRQVRQASVRHRDPRMQGTTSPTYIGNNGQSALVPRRGDSTRYSTPHIPGSFDAAEPSYRPSGSQPSYSRMAMRPPPPPKKRASLLSSLNPFAR